MCKWYLLINANLINDNYIINNSFQLMQGFNWLSTGYLPISKIKIDNVSISGDMSLYRGTFDPLIEGRLQFKRQSPYQGLSHTVESLLRGRWKEWTILLIWHHGQGFPKQLRARHDGFLSSDDARWYRCLVCRSPRGLFVATLALSSTQIKVIISLLFTANRNCAAQ